VNRLELFQSPFNEPVPEEAGGGPCSRILVPVDLSPSSVGVLRRAADYASRFGASIWLLHVVQLSIASEEAGIPRSSLIRELAENARRELRKLVELLWDGDHIAAIIIREGPPHELIVREALDSRADMIVMGTRKRAGLLRFLRRNTLARVIREASCPVLAIQLPGELKSAESKLASAAHRFLFRKAREETPNLCDEVSC
jgi:nucleotide-binding universal stress UspA family protein